MFFQKTHQDAKEKEKEQKKREKELRESERKKTTVSKSVMQKNQKFNQNLIVEKKKNKNQSLGWRNEITWSNFLFHQYTHHYLQQQQKKILGIENRCLLNLEVLSNLLCKHCFDITIQNYSSQSSTPTSSTPISLSLDFEKYQAEGLFEHVNEEELGKVMTKSEQRLTEQRSSYL